MSDCLFCKIVSGKLGATRVYEDAHTVAFMDINPGTEGHVLLVPRVHADNLFEIDEQVLAETAKALKRVGVALKKALGVDGLNVFQSNGAAAFQSVFHLHFHLLPRRAGDNLRLPWTPEGADKQALERVAERIRQAL